MAQRGVNKVILVGNIGQDPDIRTMNNGEQVANFSLATSETWQDKNTGETKEKTEWHRCITYRRLAEIIGKYVKKGSKIYAEGRLQTRKWQGQDGQDRYITEVIVNEMQMIGGGPNNGQNVDYQNNNQQKQMPNNGPKTNANTYRNASDAGAPNYGNAQNFDDEMPF